MLLLDPTVLRLVVGCEFPAPLPFEQSSSAVSLDLVTGERAASTSHMKTSPPSPPEATMFPYKDEIIQ